MERDVAFKVLTMMTSNGKYCRCSVEVELTTPTNLDTCRGEMAIYIYTSS